MKPHLGLKTTVLKSEDYECFSIISRVKASVPKVFDGGEDKEGI